MVFLVVGSSMIYNLNNFSIIKIGLNYSTFCPFSSALNKTQALFPFPSYAQ